MPISVFQPSRNVTCIKLFHTHIMPLMRIHPLTTSLQRSVLTTTLHYASCYPINLLLIVINYLRGDMFGEGPMLIHQHTDWTPFSLTHTHTHTHTHTFQTARTSNFHRCTCTCSSSFLLLREFSFWYLHEFSLWSCEQCLLPELHMFPAGAAL